jgi:hypothetical protein
MRGWGRRSGWLVVALACGCASNEATRGVDFLAEATDTGSDNGPIGLTVQTDQAVAFERTAGELARAAVERHMDRLVGACEPAKRRAGRGSSKAS